MHFPLPPTLRAPSVFVIFALACAIWLGSELLVIARRISEPGAIRRDRGSRGVVIGAVGVGILLGGMLASFVPAADIAGGSLLLFAAGIACMVAGVVLRLSAVRVLGRYFTNDVAVRAGQQVVRRGPYRYVRHPSYSGSLLTLVGVGLVFGNWLGLVALLACALAGFSYRVAVEERALREALGQPYEEYMRETRRFIPFVL